MIRTALRLATIAALTGGGNGGSDSSPVWPTMARGNVFDSKRNPIEDIIGTERRPVIVVRTDLDEGHYNNAGAPVPKLMRRDVSLILELSVLGQIHVIDPGSGKETVEIDSPESDSQLEAALDLLEWQVKNSLFGSANFNSWWPRQWSRLGWTSDQLYTEPDHGGLRLAARWVSIPVRAPEDCLPGPLRYDDPSWMQHLPDYLATIFDRIETEGGGDLKIAAAQLRAVLEGQPLVAPAVYPALLRVRYRMTERAAATPSGEDPHTEIEADLLADPADYQP